MPEDRHPQDYSSDEDADDLNYVSLILTDTTADSNTQHQRPAQVNTHLHNNDTQPQL